MAERLYWRDIRARFGIWLKVRGCVLIHGRDSVTGKPAHLWGPWRQWLQQNEEVRACRSCGVYDHRREAGR
jgi:hypothetical protein